HPVRKRYLLGALRNHPQAETINAMQWIGRRLAAVERERRNGRNVIPVGAGKGINRMCQSTHGVAPESVDVLVVKCTRRKWVHANARYAPVCCTGSIQHRYSILPAYHRAFAAAAIATAAMLQL